MTENRYYYISPWLYPILPEASGRTVLSWDLQALIYDAQTSLADNDSLTITFEVHYEGDILDTEIIDLEVKEGVVTPRILNRDYALPGFGYLQMSIVSKTPYFRRLELEKGYGLLMRPGGGSTTLLPHSKYADWVIIQNIRGTGTFCLVHPGHYMDISKDASNSALLLNPYDGPLVATIANQDGKKLKKKILARCASLVSLEPLLKDGEPACIMYSGTNRYPGWDVRHSHSNPDDINHFDHLEYYRPNKTYSPLKPIQRFRSTSKRLLRRGGYIC